MGRAPHMGWRWGMGTLALVSRMGMMGSSMDTLVARSKGSRMDILVARSRGSSMGTERRLSMGTLVVGTRPWAGPRRQSRRGQQSQQRWRASLLIVEEVCEKECEANKLKESDVFV